MKKYAILLLAALAAGLAVRVPPQGVDVAKLQPVELLQVICEGGQCRVETDTGQTGIGRNPEEAFKNLMEQSQAVIFLETAEHLLVNEGALRVLDQLEPYLRPDCSVVLVRGRGNLEAAARYLDIHRPETDLADVRAGDRCLSRLTIGERGMTLE